MLGTSSTSVKKGACIQYSYLMNDGEYLLKLFCKKCNVSGTNIVKKLGHNEMFISFIVYYSSILLYVPSCYKAVAVWCGIKESPFLQMKSLQRKNISSLCTAWFR